MTTMPIPASTPTPTPPNPPMTTTTTKIYVVTCAIGARSGPYSRPEWLGTFPSYIKALAFLEKVYMVEPRHRMAWGTMHEDGYLKPEGRYFITEEVRNNVR